MYCELFFFLYTYIYIYIYIYTYTYIYIYIYISLSLSLPGILQHHSGDISVTPAGLPQMSANPLRMSVPQPKPHQEIEQLQPCPTDHVAIRPDLP